jgi:exo-beta-1,3-glucanase (GH17 family)
VTRGRTAVALAAAALACAGATPRPVAPADGPKPAASPLREEPFVARPPRPFVGDRWAGLGICYGPYRDGQRPGGPLPTRAQIREDLSILRGRWGLLRLYSADDTAADVLAILREENIPMKVLLGAWIAPEAGAGAPPEPLPEARAANRGQVEAAVRLANAYPDLVLGVCVGNETQVSWSAHRVAPETLVGWIREARRGTALPVATADDFGFWLEPRSEDVAREVDFLVVHVYAMWNGQPLDRALEFTQERYAEVARRHPGKPLVLGEAGWATRKGTEGDQAKLIVAAAGEEPQRAFHERFTGWVTRDRVTSTWFEAFDEAWKGGPHPDDVEKHWGLFRADRTPKRAMAEPAR